MILGPALVLVAGCSGAQGREGGCTLVREVRSISCEPAGKTEPMRVFGLA